MDGSTLGAAIALIKKNKPTDEQIESAVSDWLDDHPEATTTVEDGAVSYEKLDNDLQSIIDGAPTDDTAEDLLDEETQQTELTNIILEATGELLNNVADDLEEENGWLNVLKRSNEDRYKNGLKLAIIGDSLSAKVEDVVKYHDLLSFKNGYEISNHAVSASGYTPFAAKNGVWGNQFYEQAKEIPDDTDAVLVFGSFNDMNMMEGRAVIINSDNEVRGQYGITANPSSTATELSVDSTTDHRYIHNVSSDTSAGTYKMVCNGTTYEFTTNKIVRSGGKILIRFVTIGEVGDDDLDTVCGCFAEMMTNIYAKNNSMMVGIVSPTPWQSYNMLNPSSAQRKERAVNYTAALKSLAETYHIPFLNLFYSAGLRPWDSTFRSEYYLSSDGIHPNSKGHAKYIYPHMREFLKTFNPKIV